MSSPARESRRRTRVVLAGAALLAAWGAAALAVERIGARPAPPGQWDAIVVLGCSVGPDGRATPALARRARRAAELWHEGRAPMVVLTGGVGTYPPSEAEASARILRELGVPEDAMVLEERSTSTAENARFARELVSARRVLVVTDAFHAVRAAHIFRHFFDEVAVDPVVGARRGLGYGALREVPLLLRDWLLGGWLLR